MKRDQVVDVAGTRGEKRRKIDDEGESKLSTALIQLKSHQKSTSVVPENSPSPASFDGLAATSPKSDHVEVSCISGHDGCELTEENVKFSDLDEEREDIATSKCNSETGESGHTSPLREYQAEPGELESTASPAVEAYSLKIKKSTPEKMPSEAEIEDFFAAAEKKIQKQFAEKYNFDIVEDKPLEGRYEWVQLQP
ncbi:PREDICTED: cyclin-dependent kinase inhibitor 7-like [Ipomoea nil]|uniref:cyclin-dependent kinase inhibitor 7-like n=1 Tax=Ipomoea nil TaxID=35883 RepID=UPI000900E135|nr:PREDICTED: cyclin-dependent kinase inhibitor 7-like [Ipomoea nil]